jgi:hypothetical protein
MALGRSEANIDHSGSTIVGTVLELASAVADIQARNLRSRRVSPRNGRESQVNASATERGTFGSRRHHMDTTTMVDTTGDPAAELNFTDC